MILITGGTGFIGNYLIRHLMEKGKEVKLLVRNPNKIKQNLKCEYVIGDITDKTSLKKALEDVKEVYHLAAVFRHGVDPNIIWKTNYEGTVNLIKESLSQNVKRFLYVSTTGVIGYANSNPLDENSPYKPNPNPYAKSKTKAEQYVLKICKETGLDIRIVRPAFVYGIGSTYGLNLLIKMVVDGKLKWVIGDGNNYIHPIHVKDLVEAFVKIMENGKSGEVYIAANENPTKLKDFLNLVAEAAEKQLRYGFPPKLAYLFLKLRGGGVGRSSPKETIMLFTKNWFFDTQKLKSLGWRQKIGIQDGIREVVQWLKS